MSWCSVAVRLYSLHVFDVSIATNRSHLAALRYDDIQDWSIVGTSLDILDLPYHIEAIDDLAEDNMLIVQEGRRCGRDEELATICILARVLRSVSTEHNIHCSSYSQPLTAGLAYRAFA